MNNVLAAWILQEKTSGADLFAQVARAIGLREDWFFDICFLDSRGGLQWLKRHRKVGSQK